MKKLIAFLILLLITSFTIQMYSTNVYYKETNEYTYSMVTTSIPSVTNTRDNTHVGFITRFGYSYNDDCFTYGGSIIYHFKGNFGLTMGFDGYHLNNRYLRQNKIYEETYLGIQDIPQDNSANGEEKNYKLPMWDARVGFILGRYFSIGGILGKCKLCHNEVSHVERDFFCAVGDDYIYGGFITFILPITKNVGLNMDFALTNHTGFNVGGGINITFPLKEN
jgi:hypothetical protein